MGKIARCHFEDCSVGIVREDCGLAKPCHWVWAICMIRMKECMTGAGRCIIREFHAMLHACSIKNDVEPSDSKSFVVEVETKTGRCVRIGY